MKLKSFLSFLAALLVSTTYAQNTNEPDQLRVFGRIQTRAYVGLNADSSLNTASLGAQIRRARLGLEGNLMDKKFYYFSQIGFDSPDFGSIRQSPFGLLDAYFIWKPLQNIHVKAGQFLVNGNLERSMNSRNQQFVEHSLISGRFAIERDLGLQLQHQWALGSVFVKEILFVGNGEDMFNFSGTGGFHYLGRMEIMPFGKFENGGEMYMADFSRESKPKLLLGASWSYNDNTGYQFEYLQESPALNLERDILTWNIDMLLKWKGLSAYAQFMERDVNVPAVYSSDLSLIGFFETGQALSLQAGYLLTEKSEFAIRYTDVGKTPNLSELTSSDLREYTLAFSRYIKAHAIKLQADINYLDYASDLRNDSWLLRVQLEIGI